MRRATLAAYLALAAVAAIAAGAAWDDGSDRATIRTEVSGSFSLANSRERMPVLTAANIGPGDSAEGTVEIANEGSEAIAVTLAQHDLVDTPGAGGGLLSQRLRLRVTSDSTPQSVYEGSLAAMPPQALARLAPGAVRSYEFVATLPDSGAATAAENAVQEASTSVAYSWTAEVAAPIEEIRSAHPASGSTPGESSSMSMPPPRLSVRVVGHRSTLRNGRLIVWVRCNQACRINSSARFLGQGHLDRLRPTARHAERRRFGARTRRLSLPVPEDPRQLLSTAKPRVRIVVVARNRGGDSARTSELLRLKRSAR